MKVFDLPAEYHLGSVEASDMDIDNAQLMASTLEENQDEDPVVSDAEKAYIHRLLGFDPSSWDEDKSDEDEVLDVLSKHLEGQHDQQSHGRSDGANEEVADSNVSVTGDYDPDVKRKVSSIADEFVGEYPSLGMHLKGIETSNKVGFEFDAFTMKVRINSAYAKMNPDELDKRCDEDARSLGAIEAGFRGTMIHELGHAIDHTIKQVVSEEDKDAYFDEKKELQERLGSPSKYGETNRREWLAERFLAESLGTEPKVLSVVLKKWSKKASSKKAVLNILRKHHEKSHVAKSIDEAMLKHLEGQHDQSTHGRWGSGAPIEMEEGHFTDRELDGWSGDRYDIASRCLFAGKSTVMRDKGETVAVGMYSTYEFDLKWKSMHIEYLATKRSGYGKTAMAKFCEIAAKHSVGVDLDAVEEAVPFYRAIGMKEQRSEPGRRTTTFKFTAKQAKKFAEKFGG